MYHCMHAHCLFLAFLLLLLLALRLLLLALLHLCAAIACAAADSALALLLLAPFLMLLLLAVAPLCLPEVSAVEGIVVALCTQRIRAQPEGAQSVVSFNAQRAVDWNSAATPNNLNAQTFAFKGLPINKGTISNSVTAEANLGCRQ
jgi:hypothetical protein